jgi:hypothetical protein
LRSTTGPGELRSESQTARRSRDRTTARATVFLAECAGLPSLRESLPRDVERLCRPHRAVMVAANGGCVAGVGVRIGQATPRAGGASRHGDIKARRYAVGVVRANDDEVPLHTDGSPFRQRSPPSAVIAELRASGVTSYALSQRRSTSEASRPRPRPVVGITRKWAGCWSGWRSERTSAPLLCIPDTRLTPADRFGNDRPFAGIAQRKSSNAVCCRRGFNSLTRLHRLPWNAQ